MLTRKLIQDQALEGSYLASSFHRMWVVNPCLVDFVLTARLVTFAKLVRLCLELASKDAKYRDHSP